MKSFVEFAYTYIILSLSIYRLRVVYLKIFGQIVLDTSLKCEYLPLFKNTVIKK